MFSKSIAAMTVTVTGEPDEFEKIAHKVHANMLRLSDPACVCLRGEAECRRIDPEPDM